MSDVQPSPNVTSTEVEKFLTAVMDQSVDDPAAVSTAIVASILQAKSVDEVLNRQNTVDASSVVGQRLAIRGARWMRSDLQEGPGFYALIDAANDDGEPLLITCGSRNVMAQVYRLIELNALPCYAAIEESERATAAGYHPMSLVGRTAP